MSTSIAIDPSHSDQMLSVSTNSNSCDTISSQPLAPSLCFAQCCVLQHDPYQPTGEEVLRATRKKRKVGKNEECRSFQKKWYEEFPWLTLCTTRNSVFCFYCRQCEARGEQLQKFQTYFGLELCYLVFAVTEEVSLLLQGKSTTLQDALQQADTAKSYLQRQRSDEAFRVFYKKVFEGSKDLTDAPCLARKRRPPKRIDDGAESHVFETPEDYYRKTYFEVIDIIVLELSQRFSQESLRIPLQIESTLLKATNMVSDVENGNIDETLLKFYAKDLDGKKLLRQIAMLPDLVNEIKKTSPYDHLKSVTNVRVLADILKTSPLTLAMFSEVHKLVRIFLTIPVTTATAERSFSALRRLKTYLRSTMTQEKLNNVVLLHCHKEKTDAIDLHLVMKDFATANEHRKEFFGIY